MITATIIIVSLTVMYFQYRQLEEVREENRIGRKMIEFCEKREKEQCENQEDLAHRMWSENIKHIDYMWELRMIIRSQGLDYPPFPGDEQE